MIIHAADWIIEDGKGTAFPKLYCGMDTSLAIHYPRISVNQEAPDHAYWLMYERDKESGLRRYGPKVTCPECRAIVDHLNTINALHPESQGG